MCIIYTYIHKGLVWEGLEHETFSRSIAETRRDALVGTHGNNGDLVNVT